MTDFYGNREVAATLENMIESGRLPQTILLGGPEGIGKATLVRRFAARLLGDAAKIEQDDLNLPSNQELIAEREKWPADKRNRDPLLFSTHPDFVTFVPDGPLRQITIEQMRLLRELAQYKPLRGARRVFLIDRFDRANEQAANSLLKTLEEPPEHLVIVMTAVNPYDLLPTIRSRSVIFHLAPLSHEQMIGFATERSLPDAARRASFAAGCPGYALSLDVEQYAKRRAAMLALLEAGAGKTPFSGWLRHSEALNASRSEKLEAYLCVLYVLLEDLIAVMYGRESIRNTDVRKELEALAAKISFRWVQEAVRQVDELLEFARRNVQKAIALDALVLELRQVR